MKPAVALIVVAFVAGLAVGLWRPGSSGVPMIIGTLVILAGIWALTIRKVFADETGVRTAEQIAFEHRTRMGMRFLGVASILQGTAMFLPDLRLRTVVMTCAAAVALAGALRFPRRFFRLDGGAG
jgi:hypothetical protein